MNGRNMAITLTPMILTKKLLSEMYEIFQDFKWIKCWKNTYNYNENSKLLSSIYEIWQNDRWELWRSNINIYDDSNNMLTSLFSEWQDNELLFSRKETFTYDSNRNSLTEKCETSRNHDWYPGIDIVKSYSKGEERYVSNLDQYHSYNAHWNNPNMVKNKLQTEKEEIAIYPNPVSEKVFIDVKNPVSDKICAEMYDAEGRLVYKEEISKSNLNIDVSNLNGGIYLLKLNSSDNRYNQKIVVKH